MAAKRAAAKKAQSAAIIGFEAKLWLTADKLRNNMDAADPACPLDGRILCPCTAPS
jgi:hypothetical protein